MIQILAQESLSQVQLKSNFDDFSSADRGRRPAGAGKLAPSPRGRQGVGRIQ
jgi:hypothetical protein